MQKRIRGYPRFFFFDLAEAVFISMLFRLVWYMNCLCYYKAIEARCILTFKADFFYYLTIWIS